jgi:hypothetical protein
VVQRKALHKKNIENTTSKTFWKKTRGKIVGLIAFIAVVTTLLTNFSTLKDFFTKDVELLSANFIEHEKWLVVDTIDLKLRNKESKVHILNKVLVKVKQQWKVIPIVPISYMTLESSDTVNVVLDGKFTLPYTGIYDKEISLEMNPQSGERFHLTLTNQAHDNFPTVFLVDIGVKYDKDEVVFF